MNIRSTENNNVLHLSNTEVIIEDKKMAKHLLPVFSELLEEIVQQKHPIMGNFLSNSGDIPWLPLNTTNGAVGREAPLSKSPSVFVDPDPPLQCRPSISDKCSTAVVFLIEVPQCLFYTKGFSI